jgi:hypothetical protein
LANFKYKVKPTISKDPTSDGADEFLSLKTGDYNKFDSHCDKTMVGFVQDIPKIKNEKHSMAQHKITCFWGEQETHYDMEKTVSVKTESDAVKVAVITTENKIVTDSLDAPVDTQDIQIEDAEATDSSTAGLSLAQLSSESQMTEAAKAKL